jgi:two-component system, chemotaxis family, response regulator Rcp1
MVFIGDRRQRALPGSACRRVSLTPRKPHPVVKAPRAILLVEDNPADIHIAQRALRDSPFSVELIVARDGQAALDYLLRHGAHATSPTWRRPDLVLLDLNLPRVDGREVLKQIRSHPGLRPIPVVVLSTSHRQEDVQELYLAGANTYIEKPQDYPRFVEVLQIIQRYWLDLALLPPVIH